MADVTIVQVGTLPEATSLSASDLLIVVQSGIMKKCTEATLKAAFASQNAIGGTFTNSDLTAGIWTLNHNKNTLNINFKLYDPAGNEVLTAGLLQLTTANQLRLNFNDTIAAGNWSYNYYWF